MKKNILLLFIFCTLYTNAQFHAAVGSIGTSAMYKDSSTFISWASNCIVTRGYQDISITSGGYATVGVDSNGTKKAGINPVVSLGDGGSAILTFTSPITNGAGFDFAVFENSFSDVFLELAFVEVSSDGINYTSAGIIIPSLLYCTAISSPLSGPSPPLESSPTIAYKFIYTALVKFNAFV